MTEVSIISKTSVIYANALYDAAQEQNLTDKIYKQLTDVCGIFESSAELQSVVSSPVVAVSKKFEIVDDIFKNICDKVLLNFIKVLIEKDRFSEINAIAKAYYDLCNQKLNIKKVDVVSSCELDSDKKDTIKNLLNKKLNADVSIEWHTDKSIIAGLVFKYDDKVVDTSLRTKLNNISKNLLR